MKERKNKTLTAVAKIGWISAVKSCGAASRWLFHQPKEPAALRKLVK
ncbi:MAG: cyclic lactone autoinducer peptide [Oscillospiraceae bacterium]|jgi:cyclic lactone autoinducer peptide